MILFQTLGVETPPVEEGEGLLSCTAAGQQGAIQMFPAGTAKSSSQMLH